jgi:hypothetical protein
MNERIRELYEQARLQAKSIDADIDPKGWMDLYHEKFALLIVQECAKIAVFKDSGTVATADVAGHMAAGRSIAARLIKQQFGIE